MSEKRLYMVKLGGSLITDKRRPYTPRYEVIRRLIKEIGDSVSPNKRIIIGHGGGSFPHVSASKYETHKGFINSKSRYGMAVVHHDAARLNMILMEELLKNGLEAFPIQPSSISLARKSKIVEMYIKPIKTLLEYGMIPVVYGDVGIDLDQGCCIMSTEEIFRFLSLSLKDEYSIRIIMCEEVDGIYTRDPLKYPDARFIKVVSRENIGTVMSYLSSSHGIDVTGGMKHKVEVLYELAREGIETLIISGLAKGRLKKALKNKDVKGTLITY